METLLMKIDDIDEKVIEIKMIKMGIGKVSYNFLEEINYIYLDSQN
jgi:hypothetical protein